MDDESDDGGKCEFTWVGREKCEGEWLDEVAGIKQEVDSKDRVMYIKTSYLWLLERRMRIIEWWLRRIFQERV